MQAYGMHQSWGSSCIRRRTRTRRDEQQAESSVASPGLGCRGSRQCMRRFLTWMMWFRSICIEKSRDMKHVAALRAQEALLPRVCCALT